VTYTFVLREVVAYHYLLLAEFGSIYSSSFQAPTHGQLLQTKMGMEAASQRGCSEALFYAPLVTRQLCITRIDFTPRRMPHNALPAGNEGN
jgi:hypothetical protein